MGTDGEILCGHFFYAKIGFLLALLVILDVYLFSFVATTGLGLNRRERGDYSPTVAGNLIEGQSLSYDLEDASRVGVLELRVVRNLGEERLMKGTFIGRVKNKEEVMGKGDGEFEVEEYFVINNSTAASPGVNYLSSLWNHCGSTLLALAKTEDFTASECTIIYRPSGELSSQSGAFGVIYSKAAQSGMMNLKTTIKLRSVTSQNTHGRNDLIDDLALYFNMAIAAILLLKVMEAIQRVSLSVWNLSFRSLIVP